MLNARRLPAEWEPQDGVLLTWPHAQGDWKPYLPEVEPVYVAIARAICARERLLVAVLDAAHGEHVRALLVGGAVDLSWVLLRIAPSNDSWARDHGPITVLQSGSPLLLDFRFNGWGGKYAAELDDRITTELAAADAFSATALQRIELVLEGGAIESDGAGVLLTTSACMLTPGRNPTLDRSGIEQHLGTLFGLHKVLWLEHGYLEGDDTDCHIDTLARFCDRRTIAYVRCDQPADAHYPALQAMEQQLREFRDLEGVPYELVALPWPQPKYSAAGKRLPATYANFLVINNAVLVPVYRDPADAVALARIGECFPGREIIAIDCVPLIQQYGSLHCITMQLPVGVLAPL